MPVNITILIKLLTAWKSFAVCALESFLNALTSGIITATMQ